MTLPFPEQQSLFRAASIHLGARLTGQFPYYHAYVLLHSRPVEELRAIVDQMDPDERIQFFDELPGKAWHSNNLDVGARCYSEEPNCGEESRYLLSFTRPRHEPVMSAWTTSRGWRRSILFRWVPESYPIAGFES